MPPAEENWSTVRMSERARKHYEKKFLGKYQRYLAQVQAIPLTLLVWGPGVRGGDLYEKRLQIRGRLRELGFAAVFSEEIDVDFPVETPSLKTKEFFQALSADFIIVIEASLGSTAEVHDFAGIKEIALKMMVFADKKSKDGYSGKGALEDLSLLYGNVHWFDYPKDVTECHLLAKVIARAELMRHACWRRNNLQ